MEGGSKTYDVIGVVSKETIKRRIKADSEQEAIDQVSDDLVKENPGIAYIGRRFKEQAKAREVRKPESELEDGSRDDSAAAKGQITMSRSERLAQESSKIPEQPELF